MEIHTRSPNQIKPATNPKPKKEAHWIVWAHRRWHRAIYNKNKNIDMFLSAQHCLQILCSSYPSTLHTCYFVSLFIATILDFFTLQAQTRILNMCKYGVFAMQVDLFWKWRNTSIFTHTFYCWVKYIIKLFFVSIIYLTTNMNLVLIWTFYDMDGVRVGAEEREEYRVVVSKTFQKWGQC
jgi:hypothetical protein